MTKPDDPQPQQVIRQVGERPDDDTLSALALACGQQLALANRLLVTAESCTGGLVAKLVTDIAGSSAWFDRAFITYSNEAKHEMLGVPVELIEKVGAVSEEVVCAMVSGALKHSQGTIAVALSGIAGPGGATDSKPVGCVWIAWGVQDGPGTGEIMAQEYHFPGDRDEVRRHSADQGLRGIIARLQPGDSNGIG